MSFSPLLPYLYFVHLSRGSRILVATQNEPPSSFETGLLDIEINPFSRTSVERGCDILVVDRKGAESDEVKSLIGDSRLGPGTIILLDLNPGALARFPEGLRQLLGHRASTLSGKESRWEFLVEPEWALPTALVRPGFRSTIPATYGPRWKRTLKKAGLYYLLPRPSVRIHAGPGGSSPVLEAIQKVSSVALDTRSVRSVFVSWTGMLIVRYLTDEGGFYTRFPFTGRGLDRVKRGHGLSSFVRRTGSAMPPEPIALVPDSFIPHAIERACPGRPASHSHRRRELEAALHAIAEIHVSTRQRLDPLGEDGFARYVEPRLQVVESGLGGADLGAVRQQLRSGFLQKTLLVSACHGDFKLENCLFDGDRVSGIVDWDMGSKADLSILDAAHLHARLVGHLPMPRIAQRVDLFSDAYTRYLERTGSDPVEPGDLLLLWHIDRVAKQFEYGRVTPGWVRMHGWPRASGRGKALGPHQKQGETKRETGT